MKCRSCQREIPHDSKLCHYCGTVQEPYIKRNGPPARSRAKFSKGTVMSLVSMAIVIVLTLILYPIFRNIQKNNRMEEIRALVAGLDTTDELAVVAARKKVENFYGDYPDTEEAQEAKLLLEQTMGWLDAAEKDREDREAREAYEQVRAAERDRLRGVAREEILQVTELSWQSFSYNGSITVTVRWRNRSDKEIAGIVFGVEASDPDGALIPSRDTQKDETLLRPKSSFAPSGGGEDYASVFQNVWYVPEAGRVAFTRIFITYADGSAVTLDGDLLDLIQG